MNTISHEFPDGSKKYDIVYCDPPWDYCNKPLLRSDAKYSTMSTDEICALPVADISSDNSLLFMWVVSPNLDQGLVVGQKWGFKYITVGFVWEKGGKSLPAFYTLPSTELCLIFKKGKIPQPRGDRGVKQFLSVKRAHHSEKPWIVRDRIYRMFPTQSKIELFARTAHPGWDAWGNHTDDYHEPPFWAKEDAN